ncbi:hypothetical protein HOY80DRAFT_948259 [Tuber brumale]|nr:hypothetical protein HOY80DRAFT_948259 [Tuber brumale]
MSMTPQRHNLCTVVCFILLAVDKVQLTHIVLPIIPLSRSSFSPTPPSQARWAHIGLLLAMKRFPQLVGLFYPPQVQSPGRRYIQSISFDFPQLLPPPGLFSQPALARAQHRTSSCMIPIR